MALKDTLCTVDTKELVLKRPLRGGCFEFWLNRYQTLASAFIAAVIALFVVRPAFKQLKTMNLQTALSAMRVAEDLAELAENELAAANAIAERFWYCENFLAELNIHDLDSLSEADIDEASAELNEIEAQMQVIARNARRLVGPADIQDLRRQALDAIVTHRRRLHGLAGRVRVRITSASAGSARPVTTGFKKVVSDAIRSKETTDAIVKRHLGALKDLTNRQWKIVRNYERHSQAIEL